MYALPPKEPVVLGPHISSQKIFQILFCKETTNTVYYENSVLCWAAQHQFVKSKRNHNTSRIVVHTVTKQPAPNQLHCRKLSVNTHNMLLTSFYSEEDKKEVRGSLLKRQTPSQSKFEMCHKESLPWKIIHCWWNSADHSEDDSFTMNRNVPYYFRITYAEEQSLSSSFTPGDWQGESETLAPQATFQYRFFAIWYQITDGSSNVINQRHLGSAQFLPGGTLLPPEATQNWEGIKMNKTRILALRSAFCRSEPRIPALCLGLWKTGNTVALKNAVQCRIP